ncbi:SDR family NAD(P)-dependent oxidoreductase [Nocardia sp. NPDC020380]|uniref:SDR family NAD(P)-dependent oxidoreductase n=1 Tax=Nocardia sp. NPDC020380 TaxID=3364309 RepID=UPI00378F9813
MAEPRLAGKRALVTGGSRGIGAATVRRLAEEGVAVAVNYVSDAASAEGLVKELRDNNYRAAAFQADVSDPAQTRSLVDRVVAEFGGLDIAIGNAGVEHFGPLDEITLADFDRVFHTNVAGQLFTAQAAAPILPEGGRIVLTSSISARIGVYHHALYAASKAAISALVRNLAPELAERGITINAIAPGGTATDMAAENAVHYTHPALKAAISADQSIRSMNALGRLADPAEIAAITAFLVSSDASYLTGSTIDASGGWL